MPFGLSFESVKYLIYSHLPKFKLAQFTAFFDALGRVVFIFCACLFRIFDSNGRSSAIPILSILFKKYLLTVSAIFKSSVIIFHLVNQSQN